jgi:hypothetical protein
MILFHVSRSSQLFRLIYFMSKQRLFLRRCSVTFLYLLKRHTLLAVSLTVKSMIVFVVLLRLENTHILPETN